MRPSYQFLADSPEAFLRQLTANYLAKGYRYYSAGCIREELSVENADRAIIKHYKLDSMSKDKRYRNKQNGIANIQYLRYGRFYLVLATEGEHEFYDPKKGEKRIRDVSEIPIHFHRYLILYNHRRPTCKLTLTLDKPTFKDLRAVCVEHGKHWQCQKKVESFMRYRFAQYPSYGGVKDQFRHIISATNQFRKKSGYPLIGKEKPLFRPEANRVKVFRW